MTAQNYWFDGSVVTLVIALVIIFVAWILTEKGINQKLIKYVQIAGICLNAIFNVVIFVIYGISIEMILILLLGIVAIFLTNKEGDRVAFSILLCCACFIVLVLGTKVRLEHSKIILEPVVETTTYDIVEGNDTAKLSDKKSGLIFYRSSPDKSKYYFKIYYSYINYNGEKVVIPLEFPEEDTEIILKSDLEQEYVEVIKTSLYEEIRLVEPFTQELIGSKNSYKLYINEETFNNKIIIDGK